MKLCIILVSMFAVIHSRPQDKTQQDGQSTVELEKQTIVEVTPNLRKHVDQFSYPTQRKIEESTKDILEKIAEVNKKHGLVSRKERPNYFHFPFSYSRAQEKEKINRERAYSSSPFSNPILEYLIRSKTDNDDTEIDHYHSDYEDDEIDDENQNYEKSIPVADMSGVSKEDIIPGQYIKRKIVHQQTFAIPMQNMLPQNNFMVPPNTPPYLIPPPQNLPSSMMPIIGNFPQPFPVQPTTNNEGKDKPNTIGDKKTLNRLEEQTIDNIKNIVSNTQMLQSNGYPLFYNPYLQYPQVSGDPYQYNAFATSNMETPEKRTPNDEYSYRVYGPYTLPNSDKARQNWNWPGANYFPIYIRDPFLQFYNAITSMIEYGPTAGQGGPCKRPPKIKSKDDRLNRDRKLHTHEKEQIVVEMGDKASGQISIYKADGDGNNDSLDIENIDIGENSEGGLKFTVSLTSNEREAKDTQNIISKFSRDTTESTKSVGNINSSRSSSKLEKFSESPKEVRAPPIIRPLVSPSTPKPTVQSPPIRDPTIQVHEVDDEFDDDEKSEEVSISNDGNKKTFSRDNTGSGIFIHKLKVRKGGVAIAGPGGIATAGSGGTAIVGPNGVAFTQPDSLAIAGSGTKVVAVDPTINLGDLINSTSLANRTSLEAFPPSRVGKVVAIGPVIYYNKG